MPWYCLGTSDDFNKAFGLVLLKERYQYGAKKHGVCGRTALQCSPHYRTHSIAQHTAVGSGINISRNLVHDIHLAGSAVVPFRLLLVTWLVITCALVFLFIGLIAIPFWNQGYCISTNRDGVIRVERLVTCYALLVPLDMGVACSVITFLHLSMEDFLASNFNIDALFK